MAGLRRRIRAWAMAWLVLQSTSLTAFVARDCCATHRPAVAATPACHDEVALEPAPDEHAPNGHHAMSAAPDPQDTPARKCVMRGTCAGMTFATILSSPGILPEPTPEPVRLAMRAPSTDVAQQLITRHHTPDPRPPRV
ncbi:MAG: hypothetical protein IT182_13685 [Acidobacteria bacterium]|nr:hypothetical protein [Acidobacteriota bacterium]